MVMEPTITNNIYYINALKDFYTEGKLLSSGCRVYDYDVSKNC